MQRTLSLLFLVGVFSLLPSGSVRGQDGKTAVVAQTPGARFILPGTLDPCAVLPLPPEPGSLVALADLETVLQTQAWRTPDQVALAKAVDVGGPFEFAQILGPWFSAAQLPRTDRFLKQLGDELQPISVQAKKCRFRPRPPLVDPRVLPCVPLSKKSSSFPSGHSLYLFVQAGVLAELFPESREELQAHAHRLAWARVLGGVHFPTDIVGGRLLAEAILAQLKTNAAFREAVEACRAEAAPFRMKKAG
jgi:acid phosphatase (class A)